MPIIYLLTSPVGKQYVGQSIQDFDRRMICHKSAAKCRGDEGCRYLNNAIRLYGFDNFKKEVLLECDEDMLDFFEDKMIKAYGTLAPCGYNLMSGGNSNKHMSAATRELMSESALTRESQAYRKSDETKDLPKHIGRVDNKYQKGYKISKHPRCTCKYFADTAKTMAENLAEATAFLERLNRGEVEVVIPKRELPEGIQRMGHGFRVFWKNPEGKRIIKNFCKMTCTTDELLEQAKEHLESIKK
jgi:group I intron endonuclease